MRIRFKSCDHSIVDAIGMVGSERFLLLYVHFIPEWGTKVIISVKKQTNKHTKKQQTGSENNERLKFYL